MIYVEKNIYAHSWSLLLSLPKQVKLLIWFIMYDKLHPLVLRQTWKDMCLHRLKMYVTQPFCILFFPVRQLDIYFTLHYLLLYSPQSKSCYEWLSYSVRHWHFWLPQKCYEFICIGTLVVWKGLLAIWLVFSQMTTNFGCST